SISGVDLGAAVRAAVAAGVLEKGGGHAMAAGLTVARNRLGDLRAHMEEALSDAVASARAAHMLKIDAALSARAATLELVDLLEQAGPYGAGHPQPMLAFPGHTVTGARVVGRDHVSFSLRGSDGAQLRAIAFRKANEPMGEALLSGRASRFHVAGVLGADHWQGSRRVQLRVTDAAIAG
ncbi:MAG: single-stranded-DNA-specific exonuclease RecJ, partial [Nitratireductor sp.]|nr:single-stranded-DNA-specific exonuclease RecJ [Nitratireductor sp.]